MRTGFSGYDDDCADASIEAAANVSPSPIAKARITRAERLDRSVVRTRTIAVGALHDVVDVIAFFARDQRRVLDVVGKVDVTAKAVLAGVGDAILDRREKLRGGDRDERVLGVDLPVPLMRERMLRALCCALEAPGRHSHPKKIFYL